MNEGRHELIAAILAMLPFYNTFIHTPDPSKILNSLFTKRCGTFSEPDPLAMAVPITAEHGGEPRGQELLRRQQNQ